MNTPSSVLEARGLAIGHNGKILASGLSFALPEGGVTALIGCNGAGKSTLLRTLCGELPPLGGEALICGQDVSAITPAERARLAALVTTERGQAGALTVRQLTALGRQPHTGFFGRLSAHDRDVVEEAMHATGIAHKSDSFVADLSDGERQKAMMARALAQETPLLLLDEPFSFLDVASRIEILALLKRMAHSEGRTVLYSTHDVAQSLRMADRILMFTPRRELILSSPAQMRADGSIARLFENTDIVFSPSQNDFIPANDN